MRKSMKRANDGATPVNPFAYNLRRARIAAGLSQSDLARKIWGTIKTKDGYVVARKRDRISAYENGAQLPNDKALMEIARALGKDPRDLAPVSPRGAELRDDEAISIIVPTGQTARAHLKVNMMTSVGLASKIISMLNESMDRKADAL